MNKFQIVEVTSQLNHAGTKATADIAAIADELGFKRVNIKMNTTVRTIIGKARRQIGYYRDWKNAEQVIEEGSILLLQHPFHYQQLTREKTLKAIKKKGVKIISIVHDVEELRAFRYNDYYKREFTVMVELADVIIVHNDVMKKWFMDRGIDSEKLITLEVFDYLQEEQKKQVYFERSITIAGNLDTTKCGYIGMLGELNNIKIHLYGPNFDENLRQARNIEYHGSFPVDEIPKKLDRGFGLVWDGNSIDGCMGESGQYLRFNNPHKLSLYLSSGMPVIIWKEAAEAKYVEENEVGITVDNLRELPLALNLISEEKYNNYVDNVMKKQSLLQTGNYARAALISSIKYFEG